MNKKIDTSMVVCIYCGSEDDVLDDLVCSGCRKKLNSGGWNGEHY
jgi:hypothetical protein